MSLTQEQRDTFARDGFLVYGPILSLSELTALSERIDAISTGQMKHVPESRIRLEREAREGGLSNVSHREKVWQIWDAFRQDDVVMATCSNPRVLDIIEDLLGPNIKLYSEQTLMKPAFHGSEIEWHQDSNYWPIVPYDLVSCWLAIDDATIANGCMNLIPGSHKWGVLQTRDQDKRIDLDEERASQGIPAEVPAGGCLFHHSLTLHQSPPNRSPQGRRAMSMSYMRADSKFTGEAANKLDYPLLRGREFDGCV